jgi:hypothetical protein
MEIDIGCVGEEERQGRASKKMKERQSMKKAFSII